MIKLKNINQAIIALLLVSVGFFTACEELDYTYSGPALSSFSNEVTHGFYVTNSNSSIDTIVVGVTTISGAARTIDFSVDEASTAVSGTHFTIESATVTIPANSAVGYILVKGIYSGFSDPMDFRSLILNLEPSSGIDVAPFDNQFLLLLSQFSRVTPWLGTYSVAAASYGDPGNWDEVWTVTTSADPSNANNIIMTGIAGSPNGITAILDLDAGTVTIPLGQDLGMPYFDDWPVSITILKGNPDFTIVEGEPATGTISDDGTILIDFWGQYSPDGGDFWDVFNTTWTKQ